MLEFSARKVGAESVDVREGAGKSLGLELTAHGQVRGAAEEIAGGVFVDVALQHRDAEHFSRPFAIAGGNDGGMHVHEIALLEEPMHRVGQTAARAEDGAEKVRARPQMGNATEKFERVSLLLQRIRGVGDPDEFETSGVDFPFLPGGWRGHQAPFEAHGCPGGKMRDVRVPRNVLVRHYLEVPEAGAIVDFKKRKTLGIPPGADPALDLDHVLGFARRQNVFDQCAHRNISRGCGVVRRPDCNCHALCYGEGVWPKNGG